MTIPEMIQRKQELGYSYEEIAQKSGVPLGTVQKVLGRITSRPRRKTVEALERVLAVTVQNPVSDGTNTSLMETFPVEGHGFGFGNRATVLHEPALKWQTDKKEYTIEDIYALPDGVRAELIDGKLYYMATPTRTHQRIEGEMYLAVASYIRAHNGTCEVYIPPFGVFLNEDDSIYLEPDMIVVCDPSKLEERGCIGAPDWVVEIISPSSRRMDYVLKLIKYREAGVKEYWIIHPERRTIQVYLFNKEQETAEDVNVYSFEDEVPCSLYPDLRIRLADHL